MSGILKFSSLDGGFSVVVNVFKYHEPIKMHLWSTFAPRVQTWGIFRLAESSGAAKFPKSYLLGLPQRGLWWIEVPRCCALGWIGICAKSTFPKVAPYLGSHATGIRKQAPFGETRGFGKAFWEVLIVSDLSHLPVLSSFSRGMWSASSPSLLRLPPHPPLLRVSPVSVLYVFSQLGVCKSAHQISNPILGIPCFRNPPALPPGLAGDANE